MSASRCRRCLLGLALAMLVFSQLVLGAPSRVFADLSDDSGVEMLSMRSMPILAERALDGVRAGNGVGGDAPSAAAELAKREVILPKILKPDAGTVWKKGDLVTVIWDTTTLPPSASKHTIRVQLGELKPNGDGGENLSYILADGWSMTRGNVSFYLPDGPEVHATKGAIIVLFGDSGNASPKFTITE